MQLMHVKRRYGTRQIVPQSLAALGQVAVGERESAVLFDDPQAFRRPVQVGIDDPQGGQSFGWGCVGHGKNGCRHGSCTSVN
jgi:hypothetical protein